MKSGPLINWFELFRTALFGMEGSRLNSFYMDLAVTLMYFLKHGILFGLKKSQVFQPDVSHIVKFRGLDMQI